MSVKRYKKITEGMKIHKPLFEYASSDGEYNCPNCGVSNYSELKDDIRCNSCGWEGPESEFKTATPTGIGKEKGEKPATPAGQKKLNVAK